MVKRLLTGLIISLIAICGAHAPASADLIPDEVIVRFKPTADYISQTTLIRKTMGLTVKRTGFQRAFWVVKVPRTSTPAKLIQQFEANSLVDYAEQNMFVATHPGANNATVYTLGRQVWTPS